MDRFAKIKKKLFSKRGETLTETLSSLLIIVPAMVMLAGAIVTAANINSQARDSKAATLPSYSGATATSKDVTVSGEVTIEGGMKIDWCKESDSIYYYLR